jgi:hypothetical protein
MDQKEPTCNGIYLLTGKIVYFAITKKDIGKFKTGRYAEF